MFDKFDSAISALEKAVDALDPQLMTGADAARLLERVCKGERLMAAAKTVAPRRSHPDGTPNLEGGTMGKYHTTTDETPAVHHHQDDCPAGQQILPKNWASGDDGRPLCDICDDMD